MRKTTKVLVALFVFVSIFILDACTHRSSQSKWENPADSDWMIRKIKKEGKLVAVTSSNSVNYFLSNGVPMGFQYELLQSFANHLGVKLEVIVINNLGKTFDFLQNGKCDVIALNLAVTKKRSRLVNFTEPLGQTRQVLVQRKPMNWTSLSKAELEKKLIRNQIDLGGKKVHVEKNSSFSDRLNSLSDEIGKPIRVIELDDYDSEELITMVAKGEINYTVTDENLGSANQTYFPNIDMQTPISFNQNLAWAVRREDHGLLAIINAWLRDYKRSLSFQYTYKKYFGQGALRNLAQANFQKSKKGKISIFDNLIQKHGKLLGWDWTLLASLIYQESKFHPTIVSPGGSVGLMQLAPVTARRFGIGVHSTPEENIRAGVRLLKDLQSKLKFIPDPAERKKFVLAAYNAGLGHILDARSLAGKHGANPNIWDNQVSEYLIRKTEAEFASDQVVKTGPLKREKALLTNRFVREVLDRSVVYKRKITQN